MPHYTFALQDGDCRVEDGTGVWLADRDRALDHGREVARELMTAREPQTRSWCLDVYENGTRVHEIPFATVDQTLDHLHPALRKTVEQSCDRQRSFRQTVSAARATVRESRALVARSRGKPYLATEGGQPTIRTGEPAPDRSSRRRANGRTGS
jgi:uncharacterized protein DUF6894